jgi:hypothetical protein
MDVRTEITIRPSHAPQWYRNIDSVDWKPPPPARAGTQVAFVAASSAGRWSTPTRSPSWFLVSGWSCGPSRGE